MAILVASPARLGPVVHICDQCLQTGMAIIVDGFREATDKGFRVTVAEQIEPPTVSTAAMAEALDEVLGSGKCAEIILSRSPGGSQKRSHLPRYGRDRQNHLIMTKELIHERSTIRR